LIWAFTQDRVYFQKIPEKMLDSTSIATDFPILDQTLGGKPLIYLDNAASTQKPRQVIAAMSHYYQTNHANVHRANHQLADRATRAFEQARSCVAELINAEQAKEIIWTSGTTAGFNLLADSLGCRWGPGDNIILSHMEHHANIVPWQLAAERFGFEIRVIALTAKGELDLEHYQTLLDHNTRLVSVCHVSNALGTVNPVRDIVGLAKQKQALTVIDGAQAIAHLPVDVQTLDCDFYLFSAHKLYGPTGIGVLYGRYHLLEHMRPWQGGGEMIKHVSFQGSQYAQPPQRFEAGTPAIAEAIGLAAALDYLKTFSWQDRQAHEADLLEQLITGLEQIEGVVLIARPSRRSGSVSFIVENCHHSDITTLLDEQGIAIRSGHHCAMPLMAALDIPGTLRVSVAIYTQREDITRFLRALEMAIKLLN
jgi:cysteine sulfinate desulfinase/cysteine desulfurase/selenocysteine lyase